MDEFPADTALAAPAFAYVDFGVAHGLSRAALLAAAHLSDALRSDPDARIPIFTYVVLWRELITALPAVVVPVELIRALDESVLGVTAQVVLRADDLAHATQLFERFVRLTDTAMTMQRPERDDLIGFAVTHRPEVVAMRFPIELMIGTGFRLLNLAARTAVPVREITFAHAAGYPVAAYEELFGVPVRFEAPVSALWIPRDAMTTPFAGRDPIARRYLEAHAAQMLAALPAASPGSQIVSQIVSQIRDAIILELAPSGADLARVARRVAMSTRTVQRRLEEVGSSYQDLVDDTRAAMARTLLRDRARSIVDVAFELGYADLKGFYRAFRRWTDTTPVEWRAAERLTTR
ncbi:MAG: AraC family transcriptional regulator ligand-binding domain-containing protein [Deltaproteobacteria bacterium]|nr:AraC family transcriptional regulator ligand-binding domain-containing protein [Deltaproteobacteria bacterium]